MRIYENLLGNRYHIKSLETDSLIEVSLFIIFLAALIFINSSNHILFHTGTEIFGSIISFGVFAISLNTYKMSKNNFLTFFGIGYFFVGVVDLLHSFAYPGVSILFEHGNQNIAVQLWVASRYIGVITCLGSSILLIKPVKNLRIYTTFIIYLFVTTFLVLSIFRLKIFPMCYINDKGFTQFKIISEYIISLTFFTVFVINIKLRDNFDPQMFFYMQSFLIIKAVSELCLIQFIDLNDYMNVIIHVLKTISHYFLYKAVIETSLKRPYAVLCHSLDKADNELKEAKNNLIGQARRREQIEEVLIKNEQCYELIINNSSDGIYIQKDGKFIYANDITAKLMGIEKASDLIGKDVLDFVPDYQKEQTSKRRDEIFLNKSAMTFLESRLLRKDGQVLDIEVVNSYILYHDKPALLVMFRDITPQKKLNKLTNDIKENEKKLGETIEFNRIMTEFFSNVSHDLKTPLNVILGAIQIMELPSNAYTKNTLNKNFNKYLKIMKQNCYRLLRLVNNLIDLSKSDSGYLKLNLRNYNIVSVVEDITLSIVDYAENKGIELIFDTDTEEKIMAVDDDKIERIILNLLSNAIKFTNKGDKIFVNVYDSEEKVLISVKDTGVGIPEDKLQLIFERFGQVDKTLIRNHEGSGIGLSLVRSLVEMHGGTICVKSKLGEGSEFIIELPANLVEEKEAVEYEFYQSKVERINIEFSDIYNHVLSH